MTNCALHISSESPDPLPRTRQWPRRRAVTYTETILNYTPGWPEGQRGNVSFGGSAPNAVHPNVNLIFTLDGNTNDVVPYLAPRPCRPNCPNDGH